MCNQVPCMHLVLVSYEKEVFDSEMYYFTIPWHMHPQGCH